MNTNFVFTEEMQKRHQMLLHCLEFGIPVLLEGSTGTSKTFSSEVLCELSGRKLIRFNINPETKLAYLAGQYDGDSNSQGRVFHSKGPFIIAFEEGQTLLLEEIDLAMPECLQFIEDSLKSRIIKVELPGMPLIEIHMHENFRLITTRIPMKSVFYNRKECLPFSFVSRFQIINFPDFTRQELFEIAQGVASKFNNKVPSKLIDILIDFHIKWSKFDANYNCLTVREIIATIRALANNEDAYETIMTIYGARYKENIKEYLRKLLLCYSCFNNLCQKQFIYPNEFPNCFKNDNLLCALKSVIFSFRNNRHVILSSDDGAGVTQLARWISQYFDKTHASEYFFVCNEETKCSDLIGKQIILDTMNSSNNYIKWKSGFLTKAIKKGRVAVLDNIYEATPAIIERLKCLLDQKYDDKVKYFEVPENPKKPQVEINENFRLLCTCKNEKISNMSKSFINRFDVIVLENQLKNITPTNLKKLIKFLLQTTNFTNQTNNQSGKKDQIDEDQIEITGISQEQKQPEDNIVEQFKPTDNQINLVYSNIETSMTMSQIAKLCHAVAKYIKFFEGNFEEELIVHFAKDILETNKDFPLKGKYEKLQVFLLSHLQPEEENDDEFFYQNSPILCEFMAKLYAASLINLPIFICGPTGVGKKSALKKFARIRSCNSKSKFQKHSFHNRSKPKHFYGTTTIKDRKIHFINGPLTTALIYGDVFIADNIYLPSTSTISSLSAVLEPCIGQKIHIPCCGEEVTINPEFLFIACQNDIGTLGHKAIPNSVASRFRYFYYPEQEAADISLICYSISQSFYKRRGGVPSFTKEQAMKVGEYMISLNNHQQHFIPKWSLSDVKKLFQRIHFQDTHPDKFININIFHNVLFYTMSSINKEYYEDSVSTVINLIGYIFGLHELEKQKLQKCIEDLPKINKQKQGTYIMKGDCGVICDESLNTAFEFKLPSILNGIFMISLCHYSEPIILTGPSGFKTFLSEYFLKDTEVLTLNQESTIAQLLGSIVYLTDSEAKVFYLDQICKICRMENKFSEFREKMNENQLKKEDITNLINFIQLPKSFQNVILSFIDKLFNYGKVNDNKDVISSNITMEFRPGFLLSAILQKKSLILKSLLNLHPNIIERLKDFFFSQNNLTYREDIHNTLASLILKELIKFNSNFRVFATCNRDYCIRLDGVFSWFTVIYIQSYKPEEQEKALSSYISTKQLSFDHSLIHLIINFSQSMVKHLSRSFSFIQMINVVEMCANLNRSNSNQLFNLSVILYRITLGRLAKRKSNHDKLLTIFTELQLPLPEQIKSLMEQNPLVLTSKIGHKAIKSNITGYIVKSSKTLDDNHNQQTNISFTGMFSEMLDVLHLGLASNTPVIFEGMPGQGKQTAINYFANLLGYNVINIFISNETKVEDLLGKDIINLDSQNGPHTEITKTKLVKVFTSNSDSIIVFHNINTASHSILELLVTIFDRNVKKILLPNGSTVLKGHLNLVGIYNSYIMRGYDTLPTSLIISSLYYIVNDRKFSNTLFENTNNEDIARNFNGLNNQLNPEMDLINKGVDLDLTRFQNCFKVLHYQTSPFKMGSYIYYYKEFYSTVLEFLEESNESNLCFTKIFENTKIFEGDRNEMTQFLLMTKNICDNHHRSCNFIKKIKEILQHYKKQIKQTLSNNEIFHIFQNNKIIFHFLLKNDIITISEDICNYLLHKTEPNGNRYCHFFYPELEKMKGEEQMKSIKKELLSHNPTIFENFEKKRQEGENDSYICSLIRNDSVEDFISYINRNNIPLYSEITPSIFETNSFLIDNKNTTLIEYAAFFGSIQIFRYLLMNNVELTPSLWLYSIHSKNAELIHILESNKINPPKYNTNNSNEENSYLACFIESIKCHHNDFAEYIENNLIDQQETKKGKTEEIIILYIMKYHNYSYFQIDMIIKRRFFYLCFYNYNKIVDFFIKENEEEIEKIIVLISNIQIK